MSVEEDVRRIDEKQKASFLQVEKRLLDIESSLQNISLRVRQGNLSPEQEQRVAVVEERLENAEDLQMVANLDLIKMKGMLENLQPGGTGILQISQPASRNYAEKKLADMEMLVASPNERIENMEPSAHAGAQNTSKVSDPAMRNEIREMKNDFEAFKKETEGGIKIIVASIKKILEKMN